MNRIHRIHRIHSIHNIHRIQMYLVDFLNIILFDLRVLGMFQIFSFLLIIMSSLSYGFEVFQQEYSSAQYQELLKRGLARVKWDNNLKNLQSRRLFQTPQCLYYLVVQQENLILQIISLDDRLIEEMVPIKYKLYSATSLFDIEIADQILLLKEKYYSTAGFLVINQLSFGIIEKPAINLVIFQSEDLIQADFHTFNNQKYIGALTPPKYARYHKQYDQKFYIFKTNEQLPIITININKQTQQQFTSFSYSAPGDENETIIYFSSPQGKIYQLTLPLPQLFVNQSTFNYIQDRFANMPMYNTITNKSSQYVQDRIICNFDLVEKWEYHIELTETQLAQYCNVIDEYQCYLIQKIQSDLIYTVHLKDTNSILILVYLWDNEDKLYQNIYSDQISTYKQNPIFDMKPLQFSIPEKLNHKLVSQRQKFYQNPLKNMEIISYQNNLIFIDYDNLSRQNKENAIMIYCTSFKQNQDELDFKQANIFLNRDERFIFILQGNSQRILNKNQIYKIKNQKLKQQIFDEKLIQNSISPQYQEDCKKLDGLQEQLLLIKQQLLQIQEEKVVAPAQRLEKQEYELKFEDFNSVRESKPFKVAPTCDFKNSRQKRQKKFQSKFKGQQSLVKQKQPQQKQQQSAQDNKGPIKNNPFYKQCESYLELFILNQLNPIASEIKHNHINLISRINYCMQNNQIAKLQQKKEQMVIKIQSRNKEIKQQFLQQSFENEQVRQTLYQAGQYLHDKWEELKYLNQQYFISKQQKESEIIGLVKRGYSIQDAYEYLMQQLNLIKDQVCQRI
ncbi:hypothetical protein pb186bvf_020988 [Paramecium bursaria]